MRVRTLKIVRLSFWCISLATMVLIFGFSSQNSAQSNSTSDGLINALLNMFWTPYKTLLQDEKILLVEGLHLIVRKLAHFSIYAFLGFSVFSAIYTYNLKIYVKFLLSLPICLVYSITDEYHQTFVSGRAGSIRDVAIDFAGALTGALVTWAVILIFKAIKNKERKNMRKRELLERLSRLAKTVDELSIKLREAEKENSSLKAALESAVSSKVNEIAFEEKTVKTEENKDGFTIKELNDFELDNFSKKPEGDIENIEPINKPEPALKENAMEYGASIIGKITIESAKYCDIITASNSQNSKELLELIMGKSEVCKCEILNIAQSEASFEDKTSLIDGQLTEAIEYFKGISEQN